MYQIKFYLSDGRWLRTERFETLNCERARTVLSAQDSTGRLGWMEVEATNGVRSRLIYRYDFRPVSVQKVKRVEIGMVFTLTAEGKIIPEEIKWIDGRIFPIDYVICSGQMFKEFAGMTTRFIVQVNGKKRDVYFKRDVFPNGHQRLHWFVYVKDNPRPNPEFFEAG